MKNLLLFILVLFACSFLHAQILVTPAQVNAINTAQSAAEGDIYKDTENNVFYIGTSSGILKIIGDVTKVDASLAGDGSVANPLGIAQMGASSGQVLSWNGTAWVPANAATPTTTVSNTVTSPNSLTTTVNGVTGNSVNMITGVSNTSSNNSISTTVNGITSTNVNIVNSIQLDLAGNQLVSRVNGIGSTAITLPTADGSETKINSGTNTTVSGSGTTASPYTITVPDATTSLKGVIQLVGDLTGTAINPQITPNAVTYAKIQNVTAQRLLGNPTGSSAAPSEIVLGSGLSFSGNVINATQFQVKAIQVYDNFTSTQAINNNATTLRLNTVALNVGSNYSLSNSEITVSQSGVYRISFTAGTSSAANDGERTSRFWLEINGNINVASYLYQHTYGGSSFCSSTSIIVQLNANSYIRVRMSRLNNDNMETVPRCSALNIEKLD